jgi:hypothetical protein
MPPSTGYASATPDAAGSTLTGFSFLVDLANLPAAWWAEAENVDATRGRVFLDDGATELAVDWIDYDHAAETGLARINHDAKASQDTVRIYPPVAANATVAASDTYGQYNAYNASWLGYWPLHDVNDRTVNALHLTNSGSVSFEAGKLGNGARFVDGNPDYLSVDATPTTALPVTVMAWHKNDNDNPADTQYVWYYGDSSSTTVWHSINADASGLMRIWSRDAAVGAQTSSTSDVCDGTWRHFAGTIVDAGTTVDTEVFTDGASEATKAQLGNPNMAGFDRIAIGMLRDANPSNPWDGMIDDVQLHGVALSDDWIAHEYAQANDNAAFWNTWSWTAGAAAEGEGPLIGGSMLGGGPLLKGRLVG